MSGSVRVGVLQMRSGMHPQANLDAIAQGAAEASQKGVRYLLTPEMSVAFAETREQLKEIARPFAGNDALARCGRVARDHGLFLHLGSLAVAGPDGRFFNRSVLFAPTGDIVCHYDKIHLFDADVAGDDAYRESSTYCAGKRAVVADTPLFRLGMSICYDVRFPALFRVLGQAGAQVISLPAAFTVPTGEAHWEVLVRARAIETGSFVVAAAQGGAHENGRQTFGHSMIVDPWGRVLARNKGQEPGLIVALLEPDNVQRARTSIPNLGNDAQFCSSVNHVAVQSAGRSAEGFKG